MLAAENNFAQRVHVACAGRSAGQPIFKPLLAHARYGHNETMAVYLNNIPLVGAASIDPGDTFATMWFTFTAASRNLLTFTNISPPRQDSSVFVDAVQVCATGACLQLPFYDFLQPESDYPRAYYVHSLMWFRE